MTHTLAPDHHCVILGDRTVVLDVARDTYRLLGPPVAQALRSDRDAPGQADVLNRLQSLGIIQPGSGGISFPSFERATSSAIELPRDHDHRLGFLTVSNALLHAMATLRFRGLAYSLRKMARPERPSLDPTDTLTAIAQAYDRQRSRIPLHQICLPDSIALRHILQGQGVDAALIIGVRLDPFAAHCWLQSGSMVLNDSCDHVSCFTPILIQ